MAGTLIVAPATTADDVHSGSAWSTDHGKGSPRALTETATFLLAAQRGQLDVLQQMLVSNPELITATNRRGNTALHLAAMNVKGVDCLRLLIQAGAAPNSSNRKGQTPLMMACGASAAAAEELLTVGAQVLTLSEQKVTARYYASQHNFSELAVRLATLEAAEEATVTAARSSTEAPANRVFCPHCRQYVRKDSRLLVLCRQMASGEVKSDNAYVTEFIGMPCCQRLASDVLYHSLANCSHLRKEISETMAVAAAVAEVFAQQPRLAAGPLTFYDLCCGKSLTAYVLRNCYPSCSVLAVDRQPAEMAPHYHSLETGVTYRQADVTSPDFATLLAVHVATAGHGLLCGMHLCGMLSVKAIELFLATPAMEAIVLSPCCLPGKARSNIVAEAGSPDQLVQYAHWGQHLYKLLLADPRVATVKGYADPNVLSNRNFIIVAVKTTAQI